MRFVCVRAQCKGLVSCIGLAVAGGIRHAMVC